MTIEDREVTVAEASAIFGIPQRTLYNWIKAGEDVQMVDSTRSRGRTGRTMRFRLSEVAEAIAARHAKRGQQ